MKTRDLQNKLAIITGASSGIGRAAAELLAQHGCNLLLLDRNEKALLTAVKELSSLTNTLGEVADVSSKEALAKVAQFLKENNTNVDFLVNVAGTSTQEKQGVLSEDNFDTLLAVNLKSVYLTTMQLAYPFMKEGGAVVNVSSIRGRTGTPTFSSGYAAAKAGVINITKSFALELATRKIRVNCVAPGATYPTNLSKNWSLEMRKSIEASIPLQRLGSPQDIANTIYFLVSDLSTYITGQTIDINGGAWMS